MSDPTNTSPSTTDVAKDRAAGVGVTAKESAQRVAGTASEQAGEVASEVSAQARNLLGEAKSSAVGQSNAQRDKAVSSLRSLAHELSGMATKSDENGMGAELARQASQKAHQVADFLDGREPGDLLSDVRSMARRRPGTFLLGAAAAGLLAGRVTRGAKSAHDSASSGGGSGGTPPPTSAGTLPTGLPGAATGATYPGGAYPGGGYAAPDAYTTELEPGPYETTHGIDATGTRDPAAGPLSGGSYQGQP
jgi:hypothetical protein